jgi:hypothetical protein
MSLNDNSYDNSCSENSKNNGIICIIIFAFICLFAVSDHLDTEYNNQQIINKITTILNTHNNTNISIIGELCNQYWIGPNNQEIVGNINQPIVFADIYPQYLNVTIAKNVGNLIDKIVNRMYYTSPSEFCSRMGRIESCRHISNSEKYYGNYVTIYNGQFNFDAIVEYNYNQLLNLLNDYNAIEKYNYTNLRLSEYPYMNFNFSITSIDFLISSIKIINKNKPDIQYLSFNFSCYQ